MEVRHPGLINPGKIDVEMVELTKEQTDYPGIPQNFPLKRSTTNINLSKYYFLTPANELQVFLFICKLFDIINEFKIFALFLK